MVTKPPANFSASEQRSRAVLDQIEKERVASDAKTARLKALRLAKEAEDAETARLAALNAPPAPAVKKRAPRVK